MWCLIHKTFILNGLCWFRNLFYKLWKERSLYSQVICYVIKQPEAIWKHTIGKGFTEAHSASTHEGWSLGMDISFSFLRNKGGMPALGPSHGSCTPQPIGHFSSLLFVSTALTSDATESSLQSIMSFMQVQLYLGNNSGRRNYFSWDYSWQSPLLWQIA